MTNGLQGFNMPDKPWYRKTSRGYRLLKDLTVHTDIFPRSFVQTQYVNLTSTGVLLIKRGWEWDGATMAFDTEDFKLPSCVHDALYYLIQSGLIDSRHRKAADDLMLRFCRFTKMPWPRRGWTWLGVRVFGRLALMVGKGKGAARTELPPPPP